MVLYGTVAMPAKAKACGLDLVQKMDRTLHCGPFSHILILLGGTIQTQFCPIPSDRRCPQPTQ